MGTESDLPRPGTQSLSLSLRLTPASEKAPPTPPHLSILNYT